MPLVRPAYATRARVGKTLGPEVADLAALAGFPPDPEQELLLDAIFAVRGHRSRFFEIDVICCRQNLKTGVIKQAELGWLYVTDQRLVVHSAHEMGTTREAFRDLVELIEGCPALSARLKPSRNHGIDNGAGREGIELRTGQRIRYKARTSGGGRGLSGDKVVLDEGMFLRADHMGALLPTLSARADPQVIVGSSAGLSSSEILRGIRDRGRVGVSPTQFYAEWCAPEVACTEPGCDHKPGRAGCALDDEGAWALANPQLGGRIDIETVRAERQALPPLEFARERLGWWDPAAGEHDPAIPLAPWESAEIPAATIDPADVLWAIDMPPDRARVSVAVAGRRPDGRVHLEVAAQMSPKSVVSWLASRTDQVVLDGRSPAGALADRLEDAGLKVDELRTGDFCDACEGLYDAVLAGSVVHIGQPELTTAVGAATWRTIGDRRALNRRGGSDISPLVAVAIAHSRVRDREPVLATAW